MKKDAKLRKIVARTAPERRRLEAMMLAKHVLPDDIRDRAKAELDALPKRTNPVILVDRCAISSRSRAKVLPWRVSRFVWREEADHGRLCGVKRALWGVNNMRKRDSLL
jgi:ribosomal protein S14